MSLRAGRSAMHPERRRYNTNNNKRKKRECDGVSRFCGWGTASPEYHAIPCRWHARCLLWYLLHRLITVACFHVFDWCGDTYEANLFWRFWASSDRRAFNACTWAARVLWLCTNAPSSVSSRWHQFKRKSGCVVAASLVTSGAGSGGGGMPGWIINTKQMRREKEAKPKVYFLINIKIVN